MARMRLQPTEAELRQLIAVAQGQKPADMIVTGGRLLDVYTGEIREGCEVGISGAWIASVGDLPAGLRGENTRIIDAEGGVIVPGFIDAHAHIAWLCDPAEFLKWVIPRGTTTIVTETMEIFPIGGLRGLKEILAACRRQPIKVFATAPAMVSISNQIHPLDPSIAKRLFKRNDILGLGEAYWQGVFQDQDRLLPLFIQAAACGKSREGHSAGARGHKLNAYAACGISSCHEPITAEEARDRLRLGMRIMIREGGIRRDLEAILPLRETIADTRRLILVSDGVKPQDLFEGHMDAIVQKAVDGGFTPAEAVQMATLNPAEHFRLDHLTGGIAPGRHADMCVIPEPTDIRPRLVISMGRLIAAEGELLVKPRRHRYSPESHRTVNLPRLFSAGDFRISAPEASPPEVTVRLIEMVTDLVTKESKAALPVCEGFLEIDLNRDIIKIAAIDRVHQPGKTFVAFIKGLGLKAGAIASSAAWDSTDIIVAGVEEKDMALAVNRIAALGGGSVLCAHGEILAEISHPVFGLLSPAPLETVAGQLDIFTAQAQQIGLSFPDPLLTLIALTGAAIPYFRICDDGLVNLKEGHTRGLVIP